MTPKSKSKWYALLKILLISVLFNNEVSATEFLKHTRNIKKSNIKTSSFFAISESSDFENTLDGWTQSTNDNFNWTNQTGTTPSVNTGPSSGTGSSGNYYMYIEASSPRVTGETAYLEKSFDFTNQININLSLDYHMYSGDSDTNMGTLNVSISTNGGTSFTTLFTRTGNQGDVWNSTNIDLSSYTNQNVIIRLEGIVGNSWQSDVSIDNISLTSDDEFLINNQGFSFENTLDGWTNPASGDDFDWTNAQSTPSNGTGPQSGASDGSWFMYVEMSGSRSTGDTAHLEKEFNFTGETNAELSLDYHMYSATSDTNMGTFKILVSNNSGSSFIEIFSRSGNQGNGWISETLDLSTYDGQTIIIRFEAIRAGSWQSDISIDNVQVSSITASGIPITVTANAASKEVGEADPTFTYTITSGSLEPGDVLSGSLSRVAGETVGNYAITRGTLGNPDYTITFVSATFTITEKDTDGDGYFDDVDVDDDNDGILDTDENCVIPGSANPEVDQIIYTENNFEIFVIGNNTNNGLGFQESGFEQAAFEKGLTLTRLNGSSDFSSLPAAPGTDGTAHTTTGTFTNGLLSFSTTAVNPETRRNQFRQTTGSSFISGPSGDAIYIKPSINLQVGEDYTVDIDFTTPVYAFNFDLIDILDTFNDDPGTVVKYEVYADNQLIAYFQSAFLGDDATGNVDVFDANDVSQGIMLVGQNVESSVGFLTNSPVSKVSIVHSVVSGSIFNSRADLHSIDNFVWSTQSFSCFADDIDFDGDGLNNDKDIDSDNDGIPDNVEAQSTIEYIAPNYTYGVNGLDTAYGTGLTAINTDNFGNADYVSLDSDGDGLFDTDEVNFSIDIDNDGMSDGTVGKNGLDNTLYATDDFLDINGNINDPRNLPDIDGDVLTIGDVDYRDTHLSGTPLITQILQTGTSNSIEVTNIHPTNTILANTVKFSLYTNKTGDQSNVVPDEIYTIDTDILPGASVVITDLNIVNISSGDDILLLTHPNGNNTNETAYNNRYDTTESISDNTIYVRSDEISATSTNFTLLNGLLLLMIA